MITAAQLGTIAFFFANTDKQALQARGLIPHGKDGEDRWKRFNSNFDIFILKLSDENQRVLADMINEFAGITSVAAE